MLRINPLHLHTRLSTHCLTFQRPRPSTGNGWHHLGFSAGLLGSALSSVVGSEVSLQYVGGGLYFALARTATGIGARLTV